MNNRLFQMKKATGSDKPIQWPWVTYLFIFLEKEKAGTEQDR